MKRFAPFAGLIKICGITNPDDAQRAIEYGATALGFNFYPKSPRYIDPLRAEAIITRLPAETLSVGVFVLGVSVPLWPNLPAFQLHGLRNESEVPAISKRIFIATSRDKASQFPNHEIIIDTSWGTGQKDNWQELKKLNRPFILSGGLNPENVIEAINLLNPAGVDVCSSIESEPGKKDPIKLKAFIENARRAFAA